MKIIKNYFNDIGPNSASSLIFHLQPIQKRFHCCTMRQVNRGWCVVDKCMTSPEILKNLKNIQPIHVIYNSILCVHDDLPNKCFVNPAFVVFCRQTKLVFTWKHHHKKPEWVSETEVQGMCETFTNSLQISNISAKQTILCKTGICTCKKCRWISHWSQVLKRVPKIFCFPAIWKKSFLHK